MSVSVYVVGIREESSKLREMAEIVVRCDELGLSYPPELEKYFEGSDVLDTCSTVSDIVQSCVEVDLAGEAVAGSVEYGSGAVVDLSKLPADITKLRIYMS